MTNLIERITLAIFRQEGEPADSLNPANLVYPYWLMKPTPVIDKEGFWVPRTRAEGEAGALHCVALRIAEGQSLAQLITAWCPPNNPKNNTPVYIANVKEWANIPDENAPLWNYL